MTPLTHRTLVLGGARSGKSTAAEARVMAADRADYVAPGPSPSADDPEWAARVRAHRDRRPVTWTTHETRDLEPLLTSVTSVPLLVDCLGTWLAGVMGDCGIWAGLPDGDEALKGRLDRLVRGWEHAARPVVAVSNEVGCGVVPATVSGRRFRDELGSLNARIAARSEEVTLVIAGIEQRLR